MLFTIAQTTWACLWAQRHWSIRKNRKYAAGRALADKNSRYKNISPILYVLQNTLCIATFWFNAPILLPFHNSDIWRVVGFLMLYLSLVIYFWSLHHLGRNYSPCYDSHLPEKLTISGPYQYVRHPMYLAKILVGMSTIVVSGSWWFVPLAIYLVADTVRSIQKEEQHLSSIFGFDAYKQGTKLMIPFLF